MVSVLSVTMLLLLLLLACVHAAAAAAAAVVVAGDDEVEYDDRDRNDGNDADNGCSATATSAMFVHSTPRSVQTTRG